MACLDRTPSLCSCVSLGMRRRVGAIARVLLLALPGVRTALTPQRRSQPYPITQSISKHQLKSGSMQRLPLQAQA